MESTHSSTCQYSLKICTAGRVACCSHSLVCCIHIDSHNLLTRSIWGDVAPRVCVFSPCPLFPPPLLLYSLLQYRPSVTSGKLFVVWHRELVQVSSEQKKKKCLKKNKQLIFNLDPFPDWAYSPPQQVYQHTWGRRGASEAAAIPERDECIHDSGRKGFKILILE